MRAELHALEITPGAVNPRFGLSDEAALGSPFKFEEDGRTYLPLIPLVGSAKDPIDPPHLADALPQAPASPVTAVEGTPEPARPPHEDPDQT